CAQQMLETEEERKGGVYGPQSLAVGVARVGAEDQKVVAGTLEELCDADLGRPLHSLVLLGSRTHDMEREFMQEYAVDPEKFGRIWTEQYAGKG
ncbi:diphthine synthase, partial [Elasticomyces elasticus]